MSARIDLCLGDSIRSAASIRETVSSNRRVLTIFDRSLRLAAKFICLAGTICILGGCAGGPEAAFDGTSLQLPPARMHRESIVLDIAFVDLSETEQAVSFWAQSDEQTVPMAVRRRLRHNGFRLAVLSGQLPTSLRELLDRKKESAALDSGSNSPAGAGVDLGEGNRRLQLRSGKTAEIVTAGRASETIVLTQEAGNLRGETFRDAQPIFRIEAVGNGEGAATVTIVPEIQHGASKVKFVGSDGAFHREACRDCRTYRELEASLALRPGQTIVLGSDGPSRSLGSTFFDKPDASAGKLLLIRLSRSPGDSLFTSDDL